jgi:hypothetical protein
LSVTLLSSIRYVASVDTTDQIIASESFSLADLRSTEVLVAWKGEYLPPGQFEESGRELCA